MCARAVNAGGWLYVHGGKTETKYHGGDYSVSWLVGRIVGANQKVGHLLFRLVFIMPVRAPYGGYLVLMDYLSSLYRMCYGLQPAYVVQRTTV